MPADGPQPPPTELIELGDNESYTDCGAFSSWQRQIYDQDSEGLARIQAGLNHGGNADLFFARYQEVRIRQLHQVLERYLAMGPVAAQASVTGTSSMVGGLSGT